MLTKDRIGGVLILLFCLAYLALIGDIRLLPFQRGQAFTARTMPQALAVLGIGLSLVVILTPSSGGRPEWRGLRWGQIAVFLGLMSLYGLTVRSAGFLLSTVLFLMIGFALLGERRLWVSAAVAVPLVVLFWLLMTQVLDVFVPALPEALR